MSIKGFIKKTGLLSVIKPPQVQRIEQTERMHDERMQIKLAEHNLDSAKLKLENDKFEAYLAEKQAEFDQKERHHQENLEHDKQMAVRQENHDEKMLNKKQKHERELKEEDKKNAIALEETKGINTKEIITHESQTRVAEKEQTERFLDSESERKQKEHQAKTRDDIIGEILKIKVKAVEDRKTLELQAKLGQQGVDKDKVKGWIEDVKEDDNE